MSIEVNPPFHYTNPALGIQETEKVKHLIWSISISILNFEKIIIDKPKRQKHQIYCTATEQNDTKRFTCYIEGINP